jgi:peptidoglycan/LPS O-acetylase OafA/YrhL
MSTPSRHPYFPFIDGLRAIAVASVVLYHLKAAWLPGGFAGVDIFFVISGFVVSASVGLRSLASLPSFELYFLARRLQRIAPALITCLLVTAAVSALIIPDAWLSENNQRTGLYAFFGLSNLVLAHNPNAYFSPISEYNPYTQTWSLGVEEQFYLIFPVLFWAWLREGAWRYGVAAVFGALGVASLVYALRARAIDPSMAFYLLPSRFWELAAGALLYQGMALSGRRFDVPTTLPRRWWTLPGASLGLLVIAYGLWTGNPQTFPAPGALLPVLGTVFTLGFLHGAPANFSLVRALTVAPVRWLGRISYSLYLWHWPVFVLFRWSCGLDTPVEQLAATAIALALAYVSWRFVENPVRRAAWVRAVPRLAVVAGGACILLAGAAVQRYVNNHQEKISLSQVARRASDWYPTREFASSSPEGCTVTQTAAQVGEGVRITYRRTGCSAPVTAPDVAAIGDSHAIAFGSVFSAYVAQTGATVNLYNNAGCPFLSLQPWREQSAPCPASAKAAQDDILGRLKPGDVVFLPSLRMPRVVDQWARSSDEIVRNQVFGKDAVEGRESSLVAGTAILQSFRSRGANTVIEAPNLILNSPPFRCADPWTRDNPICAGGSTVDRTAFMRLRQPALDAVTRLAGSVPGSGVFDAFPVLCPTGPMCDTYRNHRPLFFDGDHVSAYGNSLLLPAFESLMREVSSLRANYARKAVSANVASG